jgi:hypothetical protein
LPSPTDRRRLEFALAPQLRPLVRSRRNIRMQKAITKAAVDSLKPQKTLWDFGKDAVSGFGVRQKQDAFYILKGDPWRPMVMKPRRLQDLEIPAVQSLGKS